MKKIAEMEAGGESAEAIRNGGGKSMVSRNQSTEMKRSEMTARLCREYTVLGEEDITFLVRISSRLELLSRRNGADVFIDCLCRNEKEAVVIAEALKEDSPHEFSTVGFFAREECEPAVLRTLRYGLASEDTCAVTHASTSGNLVVQNVTPISRAKRTIGALIFERKYLPKDREAEFREKQPLTYGTESPQAPPYLINLDWLGACVEEVLIIVDHLGIVRYRNDAAIHLYREYGYVQDILNKEYQRISLHGRLLVDAPEEAFYREEEIVCKGRYYLVRSRRVTGAETFYAIAISDITSQKEKQSIERMREVALRETQHRTKNNLNIIYSLLDLQRRRVDSPEAVEILRDAMNRILSFSGTYEEALRGEGDRVRIQTILSNLKRDFLQSADAINCQLRIRITGDDFFIVTDTAASIALVVNEALQNCYKHAFPGRDTGQVLISVRQDPIASRVLIEDDGVGFDPGAAKRPEPGGREKRLGLQIMELIVADKLKGKLDLKSGPGGTGISFDFSVRDRA